MKRLTHISAIVAFAFAALISSNAVIENNGSSAGYNFEEVETAQNELDRSNGYEFEEVETAQNKAEDSKGYQFPEVETANNTPQESNDFEFPEVDTA